MDERRLHYGCSNQIIQLPMSSDHEAWKLKPDLNGGFPSGENLAQK